MRLLPRLSRLRIRHKIILAVSIAISVSMFISGAVLTWVQEKNALKEREYSLTVLTNSIAEGIEAIMLTGSTQAAISFTRHFKDISTIEDFRIVRFDGKEAFSDNKTIDSVNRTLEEDRYPQRSTETHTQILPDSDPRLNKVLDTNQTTSYYQEMDDGSRRLTFLAPIRTSEECRDCHASKRNRGAIQITTSLTSIDESLATVRAYAALALIGTLVVTIIIATLLLQRSVNRPLANLMEGMRSISQGDFTHSVVVNRKDELGEMAAMFNQMTLEIRDTHAGLQREQDKLTTIILGANEGMVATDGTGTVVLCNPAAETLLGKSALQITEEGLLALFDNPEEMAQWISRPSHENGQIYKEYNNLLLQIHATLIKDELGYPLGSSVLIRDVTEEKRLEDELRRLSTTDALTGLYNRRHMTAVLSNEHCRSSRTDNPLSVLMFDVDHFKKFNDTYGHDQGDKVLQAVAKTFQASVRIYDVACRYGGEEFIGILPNTNSEGAFCVAERLRSAVEAMDVNGLKVTISIGVATFPGVDAKNGDSLVEAADKALYVSKQNGRNRVTVAEQSAA